MSENRSGTQRRLLSILVYGALSTSIVSSLGILLVPTIATHFDVPIGTAQWMLTVNLLVGAVATPVLGRLSDGPHKKRILLIALSLILVGSVIAATAPTFGFFLFGRALQGLTYGVVPVSMSLARRYLPADRTQFGISSLSVTAASGVGIGYPLTGLIAGFIDFRFAFWFAALFVVTAIIVIARGVPSGRDSTAPRSRFDVPGAALFGVGLGALLLAISEGANWGWGSVATVGCFAVAAVVLAVWVMVELRTARPLINLRVLRVGDVMLANATGLGLGAAMYIGLSVVSLVAQAPAGAGFGLDLPLTWAGFVVLPVSIGSMGANQLVRIFSKRIPMATMLPIGAALCTVATLSLLLAHNELWQVLGGMVIFGLGVGTSYAAMPALIARRVAADELGSAVSFNQILRTMGGSLGSAISGAVLAAHATAAGAPTSVGIDLAFALAAIGCAVVCAALTTHALTIRRRVALA